MLLNLRYKRPVFCGRLRLGIANNSAVPLPVAGLHYPACSQLRPSTERGSGSFRACLFVFRLLPFQRFGRTGRGHESPQTSKREHTLGRSKGENAGAG